MLDKKYKAKIKTAVELAEVIGSQPRDKRVIMCHGTFDVVHPGHIRHLMYASSKGDILIASVTADEFIEKANFRPYVPQDLRALNLAALDMVDYVVIDTNPTPLENLATIKPDYFAKGYEYISNGLPTKTQAEKDVLDTYGGEFIFTPGDIVYSSSRIIEAAPPNIGADKLVTLMEAEGITFDHMRKALESMKGIRVHVVGDTIVDSYTHTVMIGGQTKTPTISVRYEGHDDYVGGAGIVAKHLNAAGADVTFSTVLGDDKWTKFIINDLAECGVTVNEIVDPTRPTTHKNAIICADYRMLKVDTLDNRSISEAIVERLADAIKNIEADCVVFSDFRHGIFNKATIPLLCAAIPEGVFKVADSQVASRWGNICVFQDFDLITPNEREARFAMADQDSVVRPLARKLYEESQAKNLILKLGSRGLIAYRVSDDREDVRSFFAIDSFVENLKDAVGAGDALLSYATLAHVGGAGEVCATVLGAMAAAVECEYDGNIPVMPGDVSAKINKTEQYALYNGHNN